MVIRNFAEDIVQLQEANPHLSAEQIGVILTAGSLYRSGPDLARFREQYSHFDPNIMVSQQGITFLKFVESRDPPHILKERMNAYLNIKFNDISHPRTFEENLKTFTGYARIASSVVSDILRLATLPNDIARLLAEEEAVRSANDLELLLSIYKAGTDRTRFEILRKIGLIILIARINRCIVVHELDSRMQDVWTGLKFGLRYEPGFVRRMYYWINEHNHVMISEDMKGAEEQHSRDMEERARLGLPRYALEVFTHRPSVTGRGIILQHMEIRHKFMNGSEPSYTSIIEKIVRKNLAYPNLVRDIVGIRIIVKSEEDIEPMIGELEGFLGGSSTRKQEKNTYHKFGRHSLTDEFYVWKAIYDMPLPHPSIAHVERLLKLTKEERIRHELEVRLAYYRSQPRDFVIEVQLQDMRSYLQGIVSGSPIQHSLLKRNQVRSNSFYKLFPKEIYAPAMKDIRTYLFNQQEISIPSASQAEA